MKHLFYSALRFIGMRDRLRCPRCKAVGTFKPHGSILDTYDTRKIPRWMCKFCGYYTGPEGEKKVFPSSTLHSWQYGKNPKKDLTPYEVLKKHYGKNTVWPWYG